MIEEVLAFLDAHHAEPLSLNYVAEQFYVCGWHLSKEIKRHTGMNYTEALNRIRIRHSKQLLVETTLKAYEIACLVGFSDLAYFTAVFKKYSGGLSPGKYRQAACIEAQRSVD